MKLTPTQVLDRAMTEAELTSAVIELAHLLGWRVAHFRPAKTAHGWRTPVQGDGVGFPDLIMVRGLRVIAAELKRELAGAPGEAQMAWLDAFDTAGVDVYIWRPSNLGDIAEELR